MKICTKCKIEKQKTEFGKRKDSGSGYRAYCKECAHKKYIENKASILERSRKNYIKTRDYRLEYRREYYIRNADIIAKKDKLYAEKNREAIAIRKAAYNKRNKDRIKEYRIKNKERISSVFRIYREKNAEKINESARAYRAANPEKMAESWRNKSARRRMAEGSHTAADVRAIFDAQRGICANCNSKLSKSGPDKYHVDHILPLARGGSNDKYNLQCLCKPCNLRKNAKDPVRWASENGRLL